MLDRETERRIEAVKLAKLVCPDLPPDTTLEVARQIADFLRHTDRNNGE